LGHDTGSDGTIFFYASCFTCMEVRYFTSETGINMKRLLLCPCPASLSVSDKEDSYITGGRPMKFTRVTVGKIKLKQNMY
jgi:hypothetical protein